MKLFGQFQSRYSRKRLTSIVQAVIVGVAVKRSGVYGKGGTLVVLGKAGPTLASVVVGHPTAVYYHPYSSFFFCFFFFFCGGYPTCLPSSPTL
jgi:hypothetical protein